VVVVVDVVVDVVVVEVLVVVVDVVVVVVVGPATATVARPANPTVNAKARSNRVVSRFTARSSAEVISAPGGSGAH
jgi:hypothetical protein